MSPAMSASKCFWVTSRTGMWLGWFFGTFTRTLQLGMSPAMFPHNVSKILPVQNVTLHVSCYVEWGCCQSLLSRSPSFILFYFIYLIFLVWYDFNQVLENLQNCFIQFIEIYEIFFIILSIHFVIQFFVIINYFLLITISVIIIVFPLLWRIQGNCPSWLKRTCLQTGWLWTKENFTHFGHRMEGWPHTLFKQSSYCACLTLKYCWRRGSLLPAFEVFWPDSWRWRFAHFSFLLSSFLPWGYSHLVTFVVWILTWPSNEFEDLERLKGAKRSFLWRTEENTKKVLPSHAPTFPSIHCKISPPSVVCVINIFLWLLSSILRERSSREN